MKLKSQVCTIEQAKRLLVLGLNSEALFYWVYPKDKNKISTYKGVHAMFYAKEIIAENEGDEFDHEMAPAFTVAELGVMLPHPDGMGELGGFNHPSDFDPTSKDGKPWYCMWEYDTEKYGMKRQLFEGSTEAEARAAILIHFLEINLIQAAEVNQRLQNA